MTTPVVARKFVKNWKLADLDGAFTKDWHKRQSAQRGAALFKTGGCITCHDPKRGLAVGPDLAKIGAKYEGKELLRHILEPSTKILEGYESTYLELANDEAILGRIVKEDAKNVHMVQNAEKPLDVTIVAKGRIKERSTSPYSTMPPACWSP